MQEHEEEWRPVVGYEGLYSVSDRGRVRSEARTAPSFAPRSRTGLRRVIERILSPETDRDGYRRVVLCCPGTKKKHWHVHRLVLEAFSGPCPAGQMSLHRDGVPSNNARSNLRWGTPLENAADAIRHETVPRGEGHASSKLTEDAVRMIRSNPGRSAASIAAELGLHKNTIILARSGFTWRHV